MTPPTEITFGGIECNIAFRLRPVLTGASLYTKVRDELRATSALGVTLEHYVISTSDGKIGELLFNPGHGIGAITFGEGWLRPTSAASATDVARRFLSGRMEVKWTVEDHDHMRREGLRCRTECRWCGWPANTRTP